MNWLKKFWAYFDAVQEPYRLILAMGMITPLILGINLCSLGHSILGFLGILFTTFLVLSKTLLK